MKISKRSKFTIIAGPCAIEDKNTCIKIAKECKQICDSVNFNYIFKSSYTKANRTSGKSFRGVGLVDGLKILKEVKEKVEVNLLTDVHETVEVDPASKVVDVLQIPAFLSRQTKLIEKAAQTGKWVNIKKGQFMSPQEIKAAYQKAKNTGTKKIFVTERGSSFGYNNLVVDFRNFQIIDEWNIPLVYDVTHSLQRPAIGKISGGNPRFAASMAKAATATSFISGLFIETHPQPQLAKSDANSMVTLSEFMNIIQQISKIKSIQ
ncbi:MAG: 3-deoxy-8-phosphooctulonate synthase [Candidatus Cloacimonetes bacterium]|nr:3-deoxy-8-phosphooctulonate synthase [Candidatus Cloacimonadota bacterium]MBS3767022.1 3-deoxy-8-phosphooctulonate synthase [Candidatus Cloacimonadota bacterium]